MTTDPTSIRITTNSTTMTFVTLWPVCLACGYSAPIIVLPSEYDDWFNDANPIPEAFPNLRHNDRWFLETQRCADCRPLHSSRMSMSATLDAITNGTTYPPIQASPPNTEEHQKEGRP